MANVAGESCLPRKTRYSISLAKVEKKIENQGQSNGRSHNALLYTESCGTSFGR